MNTEEQQSFGSGEVLENAEEATYLGNTLNRRANMQEEIKRQTQQVNTTMWKLNSYWKAAHAGKKWQ